MDRFRRAPDAGRVRLEASSDDVDEARAMFEDAYDASGWSAAPTDLPFRYRHHAAGTDAITLRTTTFAGALHGSHDTTDEYIVDWLKSGSGLLDAGRSDLAVARTPRLHPTTRSYAFTYTDFEQNLVHLNRRFVEGLAAEREGADPRPLVFDHTARLGGAELARWWSTVSYAASHFLRPGASNTLLDAEVSRLVGAAFLDLFPHERAELPALTLAPLGSRVRLALEYVHAHAAEAITTTDIARAAGTSARTLQQAFQRDLGSGPMDVLRGVRLDRVRDELRRASPETTTVADVATAWGFGHLGRFSGAYAERFGEYPKETLRRA